jgi:hypothetical protein
MLAGHEFGGTADKNWLEARGHARDAVAAAERAKARAAETTTGTFSLTYESCGHRAVVFEETSEAVLVSTPGDGRAYCPHCRRTKVI